MSTKFSCEDGPNEFMEAPCRCDCGKWFDLEDGSRIGNGKIGCSECGDIFKQVESLRDQYYELDRLDKPYKREKKKILNELKSLGYELSDY